MAMLRASGLVLSVTFACVLGCGSGTPLMPGVTPVPVEVAYEGKPPVGAVVTLHPTNDDTSVVAARPRGLVGADGRVALTTYHTGDGAPPGEYIVTVEWRPIVENASDDDKPGPDRLKGRFADPETSPLRAVVRPGSEEVVQIKITK